MCVRFSVCFLLAGLYLSSSAPTPEDCDHLVTPEPLNRTKLLGRWNLIAGFTDSEMFASMLKTVNSSWIKFTPSPSSNDTWIMAEELMMNGKCNSSRNTVTFDGNTMHVEHEDNMNSTAHVLQSCDKCLVFSISTTGPQLGVPAHSLYIVGRWGSVERVMRWVSAW
uniref:Apolipoprotein M n=1 Tax=Myripristis murdjan TaxID=586833 RepID=A0A667Y221_9TELE